MYKLTYDNDDYYRQNKLKVGLCSETQTSAITFTTSLKRSTESHIYSHTIPYNPHKSMKAGLYLKGGQGGLPPFPQEVADPLESSAEPLWGSTLTP